MGGCAGTFIRCHPCWLAAIGRCVFAPWRMPRRQTPARPAAWRSKSRAARPIATQRTVRPGNPRTNERPGITKSILRETEPSDEFLVHQDNPAADRDRKRARHGDLAGVGGAGL